MGQSAGKWRDIYEPRLWPDQYIHHALVQVLQPVMMRGMDGWCCREHPGPGHPLRDARHQEVDAEMTQRGRAGARNWTSTTFTSLQPAVVMERMRRLVKDRRVLDLIEQVTRHGIQIGAYYSQWLANTVLQPMDHALRRAE